jgi:anti-sigma factor RsiW
MTCETKNLLNAYVDGELDSAGSLPVEAHLQACVSCQSDVERLRALSSAIKNNALRFKALPRLKRNLNSAIRVANPDRKSSFLRWSWASAVASTIVVILLG